MTEDYRLVNINPRHTSGQEVSLGQLKHHVFIKKLVNKWKLTYRALCSGSIITETRVLSSSHCFLTNRKRYRHSLRHLKVVGGILVAYKQHPIEENTDVQQWRSIKNVYSQKFFRFPAYNLAVVELERPWIFTQFVNKIPYATRNHDFDGVCEAVAVKPVTSWSRSKYLFTEKFKMVPRHKCENMLLKSCRLYHCTAADSSKLLLDSVESEGSGLICHGTGDPAEVNENQGLLVGVTSLIYVKLPTLHHRVGLFHKWVTDGAATKGEHVLLFCFGIKFLI